MGVLDTRDAYRVWVFRVHNDIVCPHDHFPRTFDPTGPVKSGVLWKLRDFGLDIIFQSLRCVGIVVRDVVDNRS
ncbi:hypothetical protein [Rhizobium sp. P28RR-XV]|uniref:hypothetical protein n=1 Tax=Rhizobium sp. P28RR-XV TaxID=2726737 RepID=UPI001980C553|nr:hypothetical protein [Rhizobium sp. P28RR-XV]